MADTVRKVNYCYLKASNRAGQGAKVLEELSRAGVNLLAFSGFPDKAGKAQLDFVADKLGGVKAVAKRNAWRLSKTKRTFLIQGKDAAGAAHRHHAKLAKAKINVTAADAICAGKGRYGMILWVKPKDYNRAAKVLGAR
jgi:hypothetical protein